eukprot:3739567-Prorocentrum_lima.AAC.1
MEEDWLKAWATENWTKLQIGEEVLVHNQTRGVRQGDPYSSNFFNMWSGKFLCTLEEEIDKAWKKIDEDEQEERRQAEAR